MKKVISVSSVFALVLMFGASSTVLANGVHTQQKRFGQMAQEKQVSMEDTMTTGTETGEELNEMAPAAGAEVNEMGDEAVSGTEAMKYQGKKFGAIAKDKQSAE